MDSMKMLLAEKLGLTKEILIEDYKQLVSLINVSKKYKISTVAVKNIFKKLGIPINSDNQRTLPLNENYFKVETENSVYWLGFISADGCIRKNELSFNLSIKDKCILENLRYDLCAYKHKVKEYTIKNKRNLLWNDNDVVSFSCSSKIMINDLKDYNIIPQKSLSLIFPEQMKNHMHSNIYCRGYVDGDGCWTYKIREGYKDQLIFNVAGSLDFLNEFNKCLVNGAKLNSKQLNHRIAVNGKIHVLSYEGNNNCTKIAKWLYSDILSGQNNRYLERKLKIVAPYIGLNLESLNG